MTRHDDALEKVARSIHGYPDAVWRNETTSSKNYYRDKARAAVAAYESHMRPTVTTVDELDALPVGTILRDIDGDAWQKCAEDDGDEWWVMAGDEAERTARAIPRPGITVLHCPADEDETPRQSMGWPDV